MKSNDLLQDVLALPVWDTHTHLDSSKQAGIDGIWDLMHYFWFKRELEAAGYPSEPDELPLEQRKEALLSAWQGSRNTDWNWTARRILSDLYGLKVETLDDIDHADEVIRETGKDPAWAGSVLDRLNIQRVNVGPNDNYDFGPLTERFVRIPVWNPGIAEACDRIAASKDPRAAVDTELAEMRASLDQCLAMNDTVIRMEPAPTKVEFPASFADEPVELGDHPSADDIELYLWQSALDWVSESCATVQCFTGMVRHKEGALVCSPVDDPQRMFRMQPLFTRYPNLRFEMFNASEGNNLDIVQSARIFRNISPAGLWWFTFRRSIYKQVMHYRSEALPARRCPLIASDGRSVEWCYGKTLFVKTVLAEFLGEQIERGWWTREDALRYAEAWLYHAPAANYQRSEQDAELVGAQ